MKLSKREIMSLSILALILVSIGIYKFIIQPQEEQFQFLKNQRDIKKSQLLRFKKEVSLESKLYAETLKLEEQIYSKSKNLFTSITQEEIILLVDEFSVSTKLKIPSITFPETRIESMLQKKDKEDENKNDKEKELDLKVYSADLKYEGYYYSLLDFLKKISGYDRKIIIKDMNIYKDDDGYIRGNIMLDFYTIENIIEVKESIYTWKANMGSIVGDPFLEFNDYIISKQSKEIASEEIIESKMESSLTSTIDKMNNRPMPEYKRNNEHLVRRTVLGFENKNDMFFEGNDKKIYGEITLDKNRKIEGESSLNISYNFLEGRERNTVNISINNNIPILGQAYGMELSVYPIDKSNCSIGVIIKDKESKNYKLSLTDHLNWDGWRALTIEIPMEIRYPVEIEGLYIENLDSSERLSGKLLIDNMELLYLK
ncbi:hypothetical protein Curi_c07310 [Gottschalkia acidurici 9a]|uniref:Uncharacterized protein n=1 Tax=Gottschalkia acidurici (strain ATCC 7906 / DSM 604 / BCRC 14475 / CIP 104303 / KCTC 5404 / NCIMB 10678 / 9a) TaxID=1128398 RepID=K0AX47_GOTA9|nr:hypothetical protein [Gottschalkia acidurici]AFS77804.1 hypothetical protein Curi_c07310 [Gottschalkia acidurici 9a]